MSVRLWRGSVCLVGLVFYEQGVMLHFEVETSVRSCICTLVNRAVTQSRIEKYSPLLHLCTLTGGF